MAAYERLSHVVGRLYLMHKSYKLMGVSRKYPYHTTDSFLEFCGQGGSLNWKSEDTTKLGATADLEGPKLK